MEKKKLYVFALYGLFFLAAFAIKSSAFYMNGWDENAKDWYNDGIITSGNKKAPLGVPLTRALQLQAYCECSVHSDCNVGSCSSLYECKWYYSKTCDGCNCISSSTYVTDNSCDSLCETGEICSGGSCVASCTPNCVGKVCGDDGCGGICGTCGSGQVCTSDGECVSPMACSWNGACDGYHFADCADTKPSHNCNDFGNSCYYGYTHEAAGDDSCVALGLGSYCYCYYSETCYCPETDTCTATGCEYGPNCFCSPIWPYCSDDCINAGRYCGLGGEACVASCPSGQNCGPNCCDDADDVCCGDKCCDKCDDGLTNYCPGGFCGCCCPSAKYCNPCCPNDDDICCGSTCYSVEDAPCNPETNTGCHDRCEYRVLWENGQCLVSPLDSCYCDYDFTDVECCNVADCTDPCPPGEYKVCDQSMHTCECKKKCEGECMAAGFDEDHCRLPGYTCSDTYPYCSGSTYYDNCQHISAGDGWCNAYYVGSDCFCNDVTTCSGSKPACVVDDTNNVYGCVECVDDNDCGVNPTTHVKRICNSPSGSGGIPYDYTCEDQDCAGDNFCESGYECCVLDGECYLSGDIECLQNSDCSGGSDCLNDCTCGSPPPQSCSDSDGGFLPKTAGICNDGSSHSDSCGAGNVLTEYECDASENCVSGTKDCDDYDSDSCSISNPDLRLRRSQWSCHDNNPDECGFDGTSTISTWTCNSLTECTPQLCYGTSYRCYYSNAGAYSWALNYPGSETSCSDGHDNDCDMLTDCDDVDDCGSDPSCVCSDSDGGNLPKTAGTCTDGVGSYDDTCGAGGVITEYYCSGTSCVSADKDCDDYDNYYCMITNPDLLRRFNDWYCDDTNPDKCSITISTVDTYTCDSVTECNLQSCEGTDYRCFYSNEGEYTWDTTYPAAETACSDTYDNDCDLLADEDDPDCAGSPPGCTPGDCDTVNRRYCDAGAWSSQDAQIYCQNCDNCIDNYQNCGEEGVDCGVAAGCAECTLFDYTYNIYKGWNLISSPFDSITRVVSDTCDAANKNFYRYDYQTGWDVKTVGILSIRGGLSYWFYSSYDCNIEISGTGIVTTGDIDIDAGWTQIGSTTNTMTDANNVLKPKCRTCSDGTCTSIMILWYNPMSKEWEEVTSLERGRGYSVQCID